MHIDDQEYFLRHDLTKFGSLEEREYESESESQNDLTN